MMAANGYTPGGVDDPFQPSALNVQVTRISEADRLYPGLDAADAVDLEVRAGFARWPDGAGLERLLGVCRNLRACGVFSHLTDDHMRHLWRTRGET